MNRRNFVRTGAAVVLAAVTGCTSATGQTIDLKAIEADATDVVNGLVAVAAAVPAAVDPTLMAEINAALGSAQAAIGAISSATAAGAASAVVPQTAAQGYVQAIAAAWTVVATALKGVNLPAGVQNVAVAIQTLLPVLELAVALAPLVALEPVAMTPAEARQILGTLK